MTRRKNTLGEPTEKICSACGVTFVTRTALSTCADCNVSILVATANKNIARGSAAAKRLGMTNTKGGSK